MLMEDIFERIVVRSGQFLLNSNQIELNIERFRILVEDALSTYSKFSPYEERINVRIFNRRDVMLSKSLIFSLTGKDYLGEPDWVSDCAPVREFAINPFLIFKNADPNHNPELIDKTQVPFVYRKPRLTVLFGAEWDVLCVFKHRIKVEQLTSGKFQYSVPTIEADTDAVFFKYLQGLFLQGVGKSRRAFTLNDLPISMDASEVVSEGVQMEQEAKDDMENHQKIYLSW